MPRSIVWCFALTVLATGRTSSGQTSQQKANSPAPVAADTCVVELQAPPGAAVTVDGRDYKTKRELTFPGLTPGKLYRTQIVVRNFDGSADERTVWIEGGRRLKMKAKGPVGERPELVMQSDSFGDHLSNDGKYLLHGGFDGRAALTDVRSGRTLRYYGRSGASYPEVAFSGNGKEVYVTEKTNLSAEKISVVVFDLESGRELRRFSVVEHKDLVMSRDGRTMALLNAFSENSKVYESVTLYDPQAGQKLTTYRAESGSDPRGTFSPDGRILAVISSESWSDGTMRPMLTLWDIATGQVKKKLGPFHKGFSRTSPGFSPDGRRMVLSFSDWDLTTGVPEGEILVIDPAAGRQVARKTFQSTSVGWAFFDADGHLAANLTRQEGDRGIATISLLQPDDLQLVREIDVTGEHAAGSIVHLLPDGETFVGSNGLGSLKSGELISRYERASPLRRYTSLFLLDDQQRLAICTEKGFALWNLRTQQTEMVVDLPDQNYDSQRWMLAKGDQWLYCATKRNYKAPKATSDEFASEYVAFDLKNDGAARRFGGSSDAYPHLVDAASDRVFVGSGSTRAGWDIARGLRLGPHNAPTNTSQYGLSSDGLKLFGAAPVDENGAAIASGSNRQPWISIWTAGGEKLKTISRERASGIPPNYYAVTAGGRQLITFNWVFGDKGIVGYELEIWDLETERSLRKFRVGTDLISHLTISSNGRFAALTGHEGCLIVDLSTGAHLRQFQIHAWRHEHPRFSPDGRKIWLNGQDRLHLWDVLSGEKELDLVWVSEPHQPGSQDNAEVPFHESFSQYHWLTVTPDGLFDGDAFARNRVAYRVGNGLNVVPVDRFFQDFYRPGLAASVLGGAAPVPEISFARKQAPKVRVVSPRTGHWSAATAKLEIEVTDQGGGTGTIALFQNGARVLAPGQSRVDGKQTFRTFDVALVEGENRLKVTAANDDGSWESEPAELTLTYEQPIAKSDLHLAAIGVSKYADANLNLRFAAADAAAMADLFTKRGGRLYERVHVTTVLDDKATRQEILQSLRKVSAATRPQDTLVVFLAGHGAMVGQRYFFVPHELRKSAALLEDDLRKDALPADEINDELTAAKALKRVLIFDTCASGGALALAQSGRSGVAVRGAIERLNRSSGVFTIAAASAIEEAQESRELKHGILSYTLLAGLKAVDFGPLEGKAVQPGNPERIVDVMEWFTFAAGNVPRLTEKLFGESQDVLTSTQGQNFPLLPLE